MNVAGKVAVLHDYPDIFRINSVHFFSKFDIYGIFYLKRPKIWRRIRREDKKTVALGLKQISESHGGRDVMKVSWMLLMITAVMLSACSRQPPCSVTSGDKGVPSAGCLAVDNGELLLVKIMGGTYGPPGGATMRNESGQCAAERETWEETGVQVSAGELAAEFDNGFRLYWCEAVSGREIEISRPIEIQHAEWYAPELFQHLKWRYANQADIIQTLMIERQ